MSVVEVTLPKWGMTMQEATIASWVVEIGDEVAEGQVLASVSTEKVDADLEAPASGRVAEILVSAGETVRVGTLLARLESA